MSKVIILGAGSSKECGLPLGDEVWPPLICNSYNTEVPWDSFLYNIFPQFSQKIHKYPTFELVLTLIDNHIRNKQDIGDYSYVNLEEIRRSLIKSFTDVFYPMCLYAEYRAVNSTIPGTKFTYDNFNQWYKPFFKKIIEENGNIVFISINYDVLIDLVLNELSSSNNKIQNFTYGFDVYRLDKQDEKYRTDGILLLKPHGSINLAQCRKCGKVLAPVFSGQGIVSLIQNGHYKCKACNETLDTLILPPSFNKTSEDEPFRTLHERIAEVISDANEILIIGYSLPDYDLNILEAFLRGIVKNRNRFNLKITVVDKSNDANSYIKSKYNNVFHRIAKENYYIDGFKKYAEDFLSIKNKVNFPFPDIEGRVYPQSKNQKQIPSGSLNNKVTLKLNEVI